MPVTRERVQMIELAVYVRDILNNMDQYLNFRQSHPDEPYPSQMNNVVVDAMFDDKDDSWTTELTGINPSTVQMMLTGIPWYSSRILPVLRQRLNREGIAVEGINLIEIPNTSTLKVNSTSFIIPSSTMLVVSSTTAYTIDTTFTSDISSTSFVVSSTTNNTVNTISSSNINSPSSIAFSTTIDAISTSDINFTSSVVSSTIDDATSATFTSEISSSASVISSITTDSSANTASISEISASASVISSTTTNSSTNTASISHVIAPQDTSKNIYMSTATATSPLSVVSSKVFSSMMSSVDSVSSINPVSSTRNGTIAPIFPVHSSSSSKSKYPVSSNIPTVIPGNVTTQWNVLMSHYTNTTITTSCPPESTSIVDVYQTSASVVTKTICDTVCKSKFSEASKAEHTYVTTKVNGNVVTETVCDIVCKAKKKEALAAQVVTSFTVYDTTTATKTVCDEECMRRKDENNYVTGVTQTTPSLSVKVPFTSVNYPFVAGTTVITKPAVSLYQQENNDATNIPGSTANISQYSENEAVKNFIGVGAYLLAAGILLI